MVFSRKLDYMAKFKTRLAELMEQHGLSKMDLVRAADMSYPTVLNWESGSLANIDATKVFALMKIFNCKMEDLIYIDPSEEDISTNDPV